VKTRPCTSIALLLLVATVAGATLLLSWPRLQASVTYLPVDTAIKHYYASREIPSAQLAGLIERAQQAIDLHDHYRYHDGLSTLYFLRGLDARSPSRERRPAYEQAIKEAENVVLMAPARSMTWQRMARTHAVLGHPPASVITPLMMSIYAGRVEPTLFIGRLELGYHYLAFLDAEAQGLIHDQTLLAWKLQPRALTRAIGDKKLVLADIETLLVEHDAAVLAEMEASLGRAVR